MDSSSPTAGPAARCRIAELAGRLRGLAPSCGQTRLVGVDGFAGSGKTTFAARLAAELGGAPVVHLDDFATHEDFFGWTDRLTELLLDPLAAGRTARFPAYDWVARRFAGEVEVPAAPVVLVEGVGAGRRRLRPYLAELVWMRVDGAPGAGRPEGAAAPDAPGAPDDPAASGDARAPGDARGADDPAVPDEPDVSDAPDVSDDPGETDVPGGWAEAGSAEAAHARGEARDGPELAEFWHCWIAEEAAHFAADPSREYAGIVVDGTTGEIHTRPPRPMGAPARSPRDPSR
nr:hypothetical protein [Phaeacidiphilus oryzae]